ncbi:hypothetical protein [Streptomyces sp. enrichment culture]|uniref:hypothetical protein n=1 Tax=Streptomyces sp. enrichment culture TaxID=1795815 RepID=UPI003F5765F8
MTRARTGKERAPGRPNDERSGELMVNDHRPEPHDQDGVPGPPEHLPPRPPRGSAPPGPAVEFGFVAPQGTTHRVRAHFGPDRPRLVRPPAVARPVRFEDGWQGFQVRLPEEAAADRTAYALLEAEITAASALHRAYGGTRFGGLFPTPVGHDMNTLAPFVLYAVPRGRPLSGPTERVSLADQRVIERDLVLVVRLMEEVGLVHRGLVPGAVRWDGHGVQVWDLGSVVRVGRPRTPYGVPPFAAPEQRAGTGAADARDALWSVAQVMHQLVTGRPGNPDGPPADLHAHRSVADTLGPLFARAARERPTPDGLLRALAPEIAAEVAGALLPDPLEQFRREFEDTRRRKHASLAPPHPGPGAFAPDGGRPGAVPGSGAGPQPPDRPDVPPAQFTGYEYPPRTDRGKLRTWISGGRTSGTTGPYRGRPEGDSRR